MSRTRIRRLPQLAVTDRAALDKVLDAALLAHVAVVDDGWPYVLPMACARDGDRLLLHGSTGGRLLRLLADGAPVCATVTLLDGLVAARSAFNSSMHYRSAMVLGRAALLTGADALEGLRILTEHLLPGRWETLRPPTRKELAGTAVVALPLTEWSVKVGNGAPNDDPADLDAPVWAGVIPFTTTTGTPWTDPQHDHGASGEALLAAITAQVRRAAAPTPDWVG